jgi:hypothetical protein
LTFCPASRFPIRSTQNKRQDAHREEAGVDEEHAEVRRDEAVVDGREGDPDLPVGLEDVPEVPLDLRLDALPVLALQHVEEGEDHDGEYWGSLVGWLIDWYVGSCGRECPDGKRRPYTFDWIFQPTPSQSGHARDQSIERSSHNANASVRTWGLDELVEQHLLDVDQVEGRGRRGDQVIEPLCWWWSVGVGGEQMVKIPCYAVVRASFGPSINPTISTRRATYSNQTKP